MHAERVWGFWEWVEVGGEGLEEPEGRRGALSPRPGVAGEAGTVVHRRRESHGLATGPDCGALRSRSRGP